MTLVLATTNSFKMHELRAVLEDILPTLTTKSLLDFPEFHHVGNVSTSFEQNAIVKATYAASVLGKPCLADDSGLVVPYLGGYEDSLRRRQLHDPHKKLPNTRQLLIDLDGVDELNRSAFLECVVAFATPDGFVKTASARIEGMIAQREQGPASFDSTSVFIKHEYSKTLAQLPESVMQRISHRRKACEKLRTTLREFYTSSS